MINAQILAASSIIPDQRVTTSSLLDEAKAEQYGINSDFISTQLGIHEVRHIETGTMYSEIAAKAGEAAIEKSGINREEIDAVIYCGIDKDYLEPSTAHLVENLLNIRAPICFDISNACLGFASGMITANALIKSGECRNVLLTTAEIASRHVKQFIDTLKTNQLKGDINNILGAFSLGDAGGAMLIGATTEAKGILATNNKTDGQHYKLCHYNDPNDSAMKMGKIVATTLKLGNSMMKSSYEMLNWKAGEVDALIMHQVGQKAYKTALKLSGAVNAHQVQTYPTYGNLASATIPVLYDLMVDTCAIQSGSKVLIATSGSGISVSHIGLIA